MSGESASGSVAAPVVSTLAEAVNVTAAALVAGFSNSPRIEILPSTDWIAACWILTPSAAEVSGAEASSEMSPVVDESDVPDPKSVTPETVPAPPRIRMSPAPEVKVLFEVREPPISTP